MSVCDRKRGGGCGLRREGRAVAGLNIYTTSGVGFGYTSLYGPDLGG